MSDSRPLSVLIADSDVERSRGVEAHVARAGMVVEHASDMASVEARVRAGGVDVLLTDAVLRDGDVVQVMRAARRHDLDVAVVLLHDPSQDGLASVALECGAAFAVQRPYPVDRLLEALIRTGRLVELARRRRLLLKVGGPSWSHLGDRSALEIVFERAFTELTIAFQPIISWSNRRVVGHEALLRSAEPSLPDPASVLAVAERLGRVEEVGRLVRGRVASHVRRAPAELLFVNLHPHELLDEDLYSASAPLSQHGRRVVLELSEPTFPPGLSHLETRVASLRALGFRFALKNLLPGHVGIAPWTRLRPDFAVLDGSCARGLSGDTAKWTALRDLVGHMSKLGVRVIAAGIETLAERDAVTSAGVDLLQGFAFSPPASDYREPSV